MKKEMEFGLITGQLEEFIEEIEEESIMKKFKKGDKVELLNLKGAVAGFKIGDICKIISTNGDGYYKIAIRNERGFTGYVDKTMIKLCKDKFRVGDIVEINSNTTIAELSANYSGGCRRDTFEFIESDAYRDEHRYKIEKVIDEDCYMIEGKMVNAVCLKKVEKDSEEDIKHEVDLLRRELMNLNERLSNLEDEVYE